MMYDTLGELKRDCETSLTITEQLIQQKAKMEFEKGNTDSITEQAQKLEEENERLMSYNKALEVYTYSLDETRKNWKTRKTTSRKWRTK